MQFKYAKICKIYANMCENIRVYVFAYGAYICTPHLLRLMPVTRLARPGRALPVNPGPGRRVRGTSRGSPRWIITQAWLTMALRAGR